MSDEIIEPQLPMPPLWDLFNMLTIAVSCTLAAVVGMVEHEWLPAAFLALLAAAGFVLAIKAFQGIKKP